MTRFRISAHRLEVESGRYKKQPVSDRICKFCKLDQIEDEIHFLCNCSAYNFETQFFSASVTANIPNFRLLNEKEKFIWFMTCEDKTVVHDLADFTYKCFEKRKEF